MKKVKERIQQAIEGFRTADPYVRRRAVILAVLIVCLLYISGTWIYYLRTRRPLPAALPPGPVVAQAFKPHYLFSIYGVEKPLGVAVTPKGDRIYVTESDGERLVKAFDRDGKFLFSLTPPETQPAERAPVYVTVDPSGRVYVSDRRQFTIFVYNSDGELEKRLDPPNGEDFWAPLGVAWVGERLYITDVTKGQHRVLVYDADGQLLLSFGKEGKEPGQFWFPNAALADSEGRIYVSDSNNGRLQVFDADGKFLYAHGGFNLPRGMALDDEKRVFVVDAIGHTVRVFSELDQPITPLYELGDLGIGDGEFKYPNDIAVDETGRLYITDRENNRVQVWSY